MFTSYVLAFTSPHPDRPCFSVGGPVRRSSPVGNRGWAGLAWVVKAAQYRGHWGGEAVSTILICFAHLCLPRAGTKGGRHHPAGSCHTWTDSQPGATGVARCLPRKDTHGHQFQVRYRRPQTALHNQNPSFTLAADTVSTWVPRRAPNTAGEERSAWYSRITHKSHRPQHRVSIKRLTVRSSSSSLND